MEPAPRLPEVRYHFTPSVTPGELSELRAFFAARGYSLARLARRNRCSAVMLSQYFAGRSRSARLTRNLARLRDRLLAQEQQ
jgi:hypothetical protein